MTCCHRNVLGLAAHGEAIDEGLGAEDYAVAVHGHVLIVAFQGQPAQLSDVHAKPSGWQLQESPGGSGTYTAHGEPSRYPVLNGYGLVIHASDIDDRSRTLLRIGQKDGSLRVDGDLFLNQLGVEVLSDQESAVARNPKGLNILLLYTRLFKGRLVSTFGTIEHLGCGNPACAYNLVIPHDHGFGGGRAGVHARCQSFLSLPGQKTPVLDSGY
ncbi:Uncharacterised protein [uncultured archaeon]|nr:Uncharacterised protein [uncultured archaeon]